MTVSAEFMDEVVTFWVKSAGDPDDQYSAPTWARDTAQCTHILGGESQTDSTGAEFQPNDTYYTVQEIPRGARVVLGDVPDLKPPADAQTIRKTVTWTPLPGDDRDYVQYTG